MTAAPALDLPRLRRILQLELDGGCRNTAVIGGLDPMLTRMVEAGLFRESPLLRHLRALPPGGYRSLEPARRASWLTELLADIPPAGSPGAPPPAPARRTPARGTRGARTTVTRHPAEPAPPARGPSPDDPLTSLPGVGASVAARFEKLGVRTLGDAVFLFPRRFNDYTSLRPIAQLEPSSAIQTVVGEIADIAELRVRGRARGTRALVTDASGAITVIWWNMPWLARTLRQGTRLVLSGRVRTFNRRLQLENPEFEPLEPDRAPESLARLEPVYPATAGLGQRTIRAVVSRAVAALADTVDDPIPAWVRAEEGIPAIAEAIRTYHNPGRPEDAERARQRLALGEFLAVQCAVLQRRAEWQTGNDAPSLELGPVRGPLLEALPFPLTRAQQRALAEIERDLKGPHPMLRLLQGDVGSGKTVVAFAAILAAVVSGYQAALMAPTEILAEQHYRSFARLLGGGDLTPLEGMFSPPWFPRPVRILLVTGSLTPAQKAQVRGDTAHGGADIVIGTHALLEDDLAIPRLGLAVVDEQHRFGVMQRARLRQKGANPHLLVMTATPIPRTLALTVYGDLEVSTLDELPPGRQPIRTRWYRPDERDDAYRFLRKHLDAGEQAYIICPLVEESETLDVRSAEEEYEFLRTGPLRGYAVELLHGRMTARQKDEVMARFAAGEAAVLVSTSVIEVGIDVPNATIIIIEGAERFGLSQLHQFRGRVGRGQKQSYCLLFSSEEDPGPDARERLLAMCETTDGFALAEVDLRMRGEGETWGRLQSGTNTMLRVARLTDRDILLRARELAARVLARDPRLEHPEHRALAAAVRPFLERAAEAN
ncbi:ATP-dependent DNA helicase RecG [Tepidiforma sp.]|uniref:ATP-dependent DNA helicase RecG n=1 Tax=Tepidiforma sp. TaxID=2682230 RepID=UPI002ADDBC80|nr:ATP-dependent DNA helicase RecG [Tepidiforma sp.]